MLKKKIAVGLSGGVDSSFAAYLLKKEGYDPVGFTLKFYPQDNRCCDLGSLAVARQLCYRLGIPHYVIDAGTLFKKEIVDYFISSYLEGFTPNPCAFCNRLIKFGYFLEKAKSLGFEAIATGHYAGIKRRGGDALLVSARDKKKSQEYFLSLIEKPVLKYLIFPLAKYRKKEVKARAKNLKIVFKERKESFDACFIKDRPYAEFIEQTAGSSSSARGEIRHLKGAKLGEHKGIYRFTYGQREGIGVGWKEPLYVVGIDAETKTIVVGEKKYLYQDRFTVNRCNWFVNPGDFKALKVRVRYNSPLYRCTLKAEGESAAVRLKGRLSAVAPGQVAAFYHKNILLGGGIIAKEVS